MRDNPLHEQIIYESIMDGCVHLGDEFISVISNDKINLDTVTESISGYIINNCGIYGINSENFEIKESSLNDVVNKVLEEKRYEYYTGVFYEQIFEGAIRTEIKRRSALHRIKSGAKSVAAGTKMVERGKERMKTKAGAHFKKAGEHIMSGKLRGDVKGALKAGIKGTLQGAIGAADAGVGYARKGMGKYLLATGKKNVKEVTPAGHKTPGIFHPWKTLKANIPFIKKKKRVADL